MTDKQQPEAPVEPLAPAPEPAPEGGGVQVQDWRQERPFDSSDYLDRPDPTYLDAGAEDPQAPAPKAPDAAV